jgi:hypothetical protein
MHPDWRAPPIVFGPARNGGPARESIRAHSGIRKMDAINPGKRPEPDRTHSSGTLARSGTGGLFWIRAIGISSSNCIFPHLASFFAISIRTAFPSCVTALTRSRTRKQIRAAAAPTIRRSTTLAPPHPALPRRNLQPLLGNQMRFTGSLPTGTAFRRLRRDGAIRRGWRVARERPPIRLSTVGGRKRRPANGSGAAADGARAATRRFSLSVLLESKPG